MKPINLLQCKNCKKNLEDFIKLQEEPVSEEVAELLEMYTVFCEMRRLKEKQVSKPAYRSPSSTVGGKGWGLTSEDTIRTTEESLTIPDEIEMPDIVAIC